MSDSIGHLPDPDISPERDPLKDLILSELVDCSQ